MKFENDIGKILLKKCELHESWTTILLKKI